MKRYTFFTIIIILLILISGCTAARINQQNFQAQQRIEKKKAELAQLKNTTSTIEVQNDELRKQLNVELLNLKKQLEKNKVAETSTGKDQAKTKELKKRYNELMGRVNQYKNELAYGGDSLDEQAVKEKQEQIEQLNKDIDHYNRMSSELLKN